MIRTAIAVLLAAGLAGAGPAQRPGNWALPIDLEGAPNLHRVAPGLYRSAQPTAAGMANLKKLGIRTVINLRTFHSDRDKIEATGLNYRRIPMQAWYPEREDAVRFLRIVSDTSLAPVLVHCQHGADRTGTMCAVYRVAVQGWTKQEAVAEMSGGGYGYHAVWKNLPRWIRRMDVARLRREAGLDRLPPVPAAGKAR